MKTIASRNVNYNTFSAPIIFTENEYVDKLKLLVKKSILYDPTLVLHSDEDIRKKYRTSIIAVDENSYGIIGNSSLYPTTFPSLQEIYDDFGVLIRIGETGSRYC